MIIINPCTTTRTDAFPNFDTLAGIAALFGRDLEFSSEKTELKNRVTDCDVHSIAPVRLLILRITKVLGKVWQKYRMIYLT